MIRRAGRPIKRVAKRLPSVPRDVARLARMYTPGGDRFRVGLEDQSAPLSRDLAPDSATMLLAFGGLKGKLDIPPFEFFSLTRGIPVKRIFVRDLQQAWYHQGLSGDLPSVESTAAHLREIIQAEGVDHLVVAGTSAGGFAALLFGSMLGAETVLAFCPQTTIDPAHLAEMNDGRWDERPRKMHEQGLLEDQWLDLAPKLREGETRYEVFFDETFRPDLLHAERVAGIRGVELQRRQDAEHLIARRMRETGELSVVLNSALGLAAGV